MDAPSPRYGSAPTDGHSKGISIMSQWNELRGKYYEGMGWDKETGKPLPVVLPWPTPFVIGCYTMLTKSIREVIQCVLEIPSERMIRRSRL